MNKRQKKKLTKKRQVALVAANKSAKKKLSKAPAAQPVVACSNAKLPPPTVIKPAKPKCGPNYPVCALKDFVEIKCQHGRSASPEKKILEVVPAEVGDTISLSTQLKGGCGKPPEWEISGFLTSKKSGAKASFNAEPWKVNVLRWINKIVPRTYRVRAGTVCQGMTQSIEVKVYPTDKYSLTFNGLPKSIKEKLDWAIENVLGAYLPNIKGEVANGTLTASAGWEEYDQDYRAFYAYDVAVGFNPLLGFNIRLPFGPTAAIPTWLKKYGDAYFFAELKGGINLNGHWGRKSPDKRAMWVDGKGSIAGSVGASLFLMKPKVASAEVAGTTGIEGSAETDPSIEDNIGVKLKLVWQGVKGTISIKMAWGWVEVNEEFKLVDEKPLMPERSYKLLPEN